MGKIIKIVMIILVGIVVISTTVYASVLVDPALSPDTYKPRPNLENDNRQFIEKGNQIIGAIQFLGTAMSVITLITLGIRYMLGSTQEKALYKETMGPYLIGAVMVFAIPNLIGIMYKLITTNIKTN